MKIGILIHENERPFDRSSLFVRLLAEEWKGLGLDIEVIRGVRRSVEVDLLVPQVDLTVLPKQYVEYFARYPRVINRGLVDISKRRISTNCLARSDSWSGPVIVKPNLNFGGRPERRLLRPAGGVRGAARLLMSRFGPKRTRRKQSENSYQVYDGLTDVPAQVFDDPQFIVERFIPERHDDLYALNYWLFLGTREVSRRQLSKDPIVKSTGLTTVESSPPPDSIRQRRRELSVDYAKMDYLMDDEKATAIDVNRTPGFSPPPTERHFQIARELAPGILDYLPGGALDEQSLG